MSRGARGGALNLPARARRERMRTLALRQNGLCHICGHTVQWVRDGSDEAPGILRLNPDSTALDTLRLAHRGCIDRR